MKNETSYKLDSNARLWVRSRDSRWQLASPEEADRIFLCYPEIAAQAFWIGERPRERQAARPSAALAA